MAIARRVERWEQGAELPTLFRAFLAGDDRAFAEMYRQLNPRLSAYCYKLVSREYSEDVMQELWEKVIAMRDKRSMAGNPKPEIDSPLAFLFRTLKNLAVDHFRKTPISREITEEDCRTEVEPTTDLTTIVLEALEKLAFEDREVLVLNIYSGYKFGEIAEIQGKSVDAVWARASRARTKLREIVKADARRLGISLPDAERSHTGKMESARQAEGHTLVVERGKNHMEAI